MLWVWYIINQGCLVIGVSSVRLTIVRSNSFSFHQPHTLKCGSSFWMRIYSKLLSRRRLRYLIAFVNPPTNGYPLHPMLAEPNSNGGHTPKLRTACENCRQSKVKCNLSGKNMCIRCLRHGLQCRYGFANRSGKPKGSKNRATLRKMGQLPEERPGRSGLGDRRQPEFVVDRKCVAEPLRMSYAVDQSMDDVCPPVP